MRDLYPVETIIKALCCIVLPAQPYRQGGPSRTRPWGTGPENRPRGVLGAWIFAIREFGL